jgi:hypothetical protein
MAFVYHGSASGLSLTADWSGESDQQNARYGYSVSGAGDVNGDGYSDVIVGAPEFDNGEDGEGMAFVYHGSASGLSLTADWTVESDDDYANLGYSVSGAGDVNGDGYSDVIVGVWFYTNGQAGEGAAFVYHGSASGLSLNADWIGESDQELANYGCSVSSAGDVNGDGYSDVIVGARFYDNGQTDEGMAFVYHGSVSGLSPAADWTAESDQAEARFGAAVATAGDVSGDGFSDVIVGATEFDNGEFDEGMAFVYHGSASGLSPAADWTAESDQGNASFGEGVAGAGDVNGDGYSDVVIGAPYYDNGQSNEGMAFLYHGNESTGVLVKPEQMRFDFSVPVVPPLFTHSNTSFGSRICGRSIVGRAIVKAQFEVKELGIPFDGTGLIETDWLDLDTTGMEISQVLNGLVANTLYKWRVRIKYHPKYGAPLHSRWYFIQSNGMTECDLRTGVYAGVNEHPSVKPYAGLRLMAAYVPGGVKFRCSAPAGLGGGDLVICNLLGAEIDRVELSLHDAGTYHLEWQGKNREGTILPCGVYFARVVTTRTISNTVKFVLIK